MRNQSFSYYVLEVILVVSFVTAFAGGCRTASAQEDDQTVTTTVSPRVESTTTPTVSPSLRAKREEERIKRTNQIKEQAQARVAAIIESQKAKREEMKQKIATLKDSRKKSHAEKLTNQIDKVNEQLSQTHLKFITHIEKILDRIEDRADTLETQGGLVTSVRTQITESRTLLVSSKEKILTQQKKEYVVEIATEETLSQVYRAAIHQMRDDHRSLRTELKTVTQKVRATFTALKAISQSVASSSPSPSNELGE